MGKSSSNKILVLGGSLGSYENLKKLLKLFPAELDIPIVYIFHQRTKGGKMAPHLQALTHYRVQEVRGGEKPEVGTLYLSVPDKHLKFDFSGKFALSSDDELNHTRPNIDLFLRFAANTFQENCIVGILSGGNDDGAKGGRFVAEKGGVVWCLRESVVEANRMVRALKVEYPEVQSLFYEQVVDLLLKM